MPDDIDLNDLDEDIRAELRTLVRMKAQLVGGHLVMAGRLIDEELAASERFSAELIRRAYPKGAPPLSRGLSLQVVCHQAGQAGRNDVTQVLLPPPRR